MARALGLFGSVLPSAAKLTISYDCGEFVGYDCGELESRNRKKPKTLRGRCSPFCSASLKSSFFGAFGT